MPLRASKKVKDVLEPAQSDSITDVFGDGEPWSEHPSEADEQTPPRLVHDDEESILYSVSDVETYESLSSYQYKGANLTFTPFLRIFPYTVDRQVSDEQRWAPSLDGPKSEVAFFRRLVEYNGLVGGHLAVELSTGKYAVGSAALLSPPIKEGNDRFVTYWATALHVVCDAVRIIINPCVTHKVGEYDIGMDRELEILRKGNEADNFKTLFTLQDYSPAKGVFSCFCKGQERPFRLGHPDLAFGRVVSSTADWPSLAHTLKWPIPTPLPMRCGQLIVKIGYPGYIRQERFKLIHGGQITDPSLLDLAISAVKQRVLQEKTLSIAPAQVHSVGRESRIIKDNGSSWGGMSGGATLDLKQPSRLVGIHIGSCKGRDKNHFVSVHHPYYVLSFVDLLSPFLNEIAPEIEQKRALLSYLGSHKHLLKRAGFWKNVEPYFGEWKGLQG